MKEAATIEDNMKEEKVKQTINELQSEISVQFLLNIHTYIYIYIYRKH